MLSLSLLGAFEFDTGRQPVTQLTAQKAQALLAFLAVNSRQVHKRDTLMALLWPDYPHSSAQQSLRQALYALRRAFDPGGTPAPLIHAERFTVALNRDRLSLDVDQFEALSDSGRTPRDWQQAAALYRGHFLADFYLPDSEPFEEWAAGKRAFYQRRMQELLARLADYYLAAGDDAAAEMTVRRQLALDNLQESAHRRLLMILAGTGRRQEALTHFQSLRQLLQAELAVDPEPETVALVDAISSGSLPAKSAAPPRRPAPAAHNLPHLLTSFIGREQEMAGIKDVVNEHRLVTLTGVGGIGKTTLSIQVGHALKESFADGVWLVELAAVRDDALVGQTVFHALGLREGSNRPLLEVLLGYLQDRECLLILDNCEHVIHAAAQLIQSLLQSCPRLKVLATSREILNLPGERPFAVPPLSLPREMPQFTLDQWSQYEALRLFVERARTHRPEYEVTPANLALLLQICQQLDGIPLALELAAARVDMLTTSQIAARLADRFRLLTTGKRTALPRQQTLKGLVDWSWELLSSSEQALLRRLSVFAGGMTLASATAVCVDTAVDELAVLNGLTQLVNKSLLVNNRAQGRQGRYHLLETIRQYGQDRLAEAGEVETFRQRHLAYFQQLGERAAVALIGPEQGIWLDRLDEELDNIRSALSWAREVDTRAGIQLISNVAWFIWARGHGREMETWLAQSLEQLAPGPTAVRALALKMQGILLRFRSQNTAAQAALQQSLSCYRELDDRAGIAETTGLIGSLRIDSEDSEPYIQESLSIAREIDDKMLLADALRCWGLRQRRLDFQQAQTLLEESLTLFRELGHLGAIAVVLGDLGNLAMWQGDYRAARGLMEESLALQEQLRLEESAFGWHNIGTLYYRLGDYAAARAALEKAIIVGQRTGADGNWPRVQLGYTHLRQGKLAEAWQTLSQCVDRFGAANNTVGVIYTLEGLASFAVYREQAQTAVSLLAWADTMRQAIKDARPPVEQADVDKDMAVVRDILSKSEYDIAYAAGKEMTMAQAVALAMGLVNR